MTNTAHYPAAFIHEGTNDELMRLHECEVRAESDIERVVAAYSTQSLSAIACDLRSMGQHFHALLHEGLERERRRAERAISFQRDAYDRGYAEAAGVIADWLKAQTFGDDAPPDSFAAGIYAATQDFSEDIRNGAPFNER